MGGLPARGSVVRACLAEGLLNNVERPPVKDAQTGRLLFPGEAVPHFNEVDECAGLDGLITYICKYAQEYLAVAGLRYRLDVPAHLPGAPIPPELRHNVFLASKEAITNIVRHAKASAVSIRLRLEPTTFILEIEDNGRGVAGLDGTTAQSRNGVRNMRKRMQDIGGSFSIDRAPEAGTLVRLIVPIDNR